jgi:hypothetical protein
MHHEFLKPPNSSEQPEDVDVTRLFDSLAVFHSGYKDKIRPCVYLTNVLERQDIALNNTVIASFNR